MPLTVGLDVASAQTPSASAERQQMLRVHLVCGGCDISFLTAPITFANFQAGPADSDVIVTTPQDLSAERWHLQFAGRGRFVGRDRAIEVVLPETRSAYENRQLLTRLLTLGLVEYAADTVAGARLDVTVGPREALPDAVIVDIGPDLSIRVREPTARSVTRSQPADPWNKWVFHVNIEADGRGEQRSFEQTHHLSASTHRTSDQWKLRIGASRSLSRSSFDVGDGVDVTGRVSDWSIDALGIKSAGAHLSVAVAAAVTSSSFSNEQRVVRASAGVEYDVFPYLEAAKRSLTIQYMVGRAQYNYAEETVFGFLTERVLQHGLDASLGLRQPWGQVGATLLYRQQIPHSDRSRLTVGTTLNIRVSRHVAITGSGTYARIRDQFTLPRGEASEEEVLLRLRQLETGYRYAATAGVSFSFGAVSNATVNPRFAR